MQTIRYLYDIDIVHYILVLKCVDKYGFSIVCLIPMLGLLNCGFWFDIQ